MHEMRGMWITAYGAWALLVKKDLSVSEQETYRRLTFCFLFLEVGETWKTQSSWSLWLWWPCL